MLWLAFVDKVVCKATVKALFGCRNEIGCYAAKRTAAIFTFAAPNYFIKPLAIIADYVFT